MAGGYECKTCHESIRVGGGCGCTEAAEQAKELGLRAHLSTTRPSPEGKLSFEVGAKCGYWPCLKGPFVSVSFGFRRIDVWYGLPSYWAKGKAPPS